MNCPKCGFEQEERLDCIRCGIVFSKYFAFHVPGRPVASPADIPPPFPEPVPAASDGTIAELRQALREVQRRLTEVEFDRAERARLRKDLRALEERVGTEFERMHRLLQAGASSAPSQPALAPVPEPDRVTPLAGEVALLRERFSAEISLLGTRLEELQQTVAGLPERPDLPETVSPDEFVELEQELKETYLRPLRDRMDELETALARSAEERRAAPDVRIDEIPRALQERLAELERRLSGIRQEWVASGYAELLPKLARGLSELEDFRNSLQNVSVRYSEIGELKKNHLVVVNSLESVRMTLEALKRQIADGFPRTLLELGKEVAALRAEYRQVWQELHPSDAGLRSIS